MAPNIQDLPSGHSETRIGDDTRKLVLVDDDSLKSVADAPEVIRDRVDRMSEDALRYYADDTGAERGDQLVPIFGVDKVWKREVAETARQL